MRKTKILMINAANGPDYLADMVYIDLATNDNLIVETNKVPAYLYESYSSLDSLYGRGFTLYGNLSHSILPKVCSSEQIKHRVAIKTYDWIVYSSVRRCSRFWEYATMHYPYQRILAVDGEDDEFISIKHACDSVYFKRELSAVASIAVAPISFFLPPLILNKIASSVSPAEVKSSLLAPCDPRNKMSYVYNDEFAYYQQYTTSYFGYTKKKGGWDCLRHYEIIASGSLPFFDNIQSLPRTTMKNYPRSLQIQANQLFCIAIKSESIDSEFKAQYYYLLDRFQSWLREKGLRNEVAVYMSQSNVCGDQNGNPLRPAVLMLSLLASNFVWSLKCKLRSVLG